MPARGRSPSQVQEDAPHLRCLGSHGRMNRGVCVSHPEPAPPPSPPHFSIPLSPPHPHSQPLFLSSRPFCTHTEERTWILPVGASSGGPGCSCPAFTMAAFSVLGLSPVCAPRSLPLPSDEHTHACTHSSVLPWASCPLSPAWGCDHRAFSPALQSRPTLRMLTGVRQPSRAQAGPGGHVGHVHVGSSSS